MAVRWNLGCGNDVREGYVNVDLKGGKGVEKKHLVKFMESQPDQSADEIVLYDIIEHFPHGIRSVGDNLKYDPIFVTSLGILELAYRKLRKDGVVHIRVPDMSWILEQCTNGEFNWDRMVWTIFGQQDSTVDAHQTAWTSNKLLQVLNDIGFVGVQVGRVIPNIIASARKPE